MCTLLVYLWTLATTLARVHGCMYKTILFTLTSFQNLLVTIELSNNLPQRSIPPNAKDHDITNIDQVVIMRSTSRLKKSGYNILLIDFVNVQWKYLSNNNGKTRRKWVAMEGAPIRVKKKNLSRTILTTTEYHIFKITLYIISNQVSKNHIFLMIEIRKNQGTRSYALAISSLNTTSSFAKVTPWHIFWAWRTL